MTVNKKVPNKNQLMEYAYEHYDVFTKHLYALLSNKPCSDATWKASPFAAQIQDAFEQSGYAFNQTVEPVPCFLINAENTYAFMQKWCLQQRKKGRTVSAITADLQPVYKLLSKGSDALCNRVGEFFQSTVIDTVENNGINYWRVLYFEPRKGGKLIVKNLSRKETFGKHVFIIDVDYLLLPFRVKFERKCGSNHEKNYARMRYGYDRMVVKPGAEH